MGRSGKVGKRSDAAAGRRGMTLYEVMVALVVLTVSSYMLTSTIASTLSETAAKRERAAAADAARNVLESMRSQPIGQLFALYDHATSDDPAGPGTAPGPHFDVEGLEPAVDDPDGHVGEVLLPATGPPLVESAVSPSLGLPRDLDGDHAIDANDHSTNYLVLPVGVRVTWKSRAGKQTLVLYTLFSKLEKP